MWYYKVLTVLWLDNVRIGWVPAHKCTTVGPGCWKASEHVSLSHSSRTEIGWLLMFVLQKTDFGIPVKQTVGTLFWHSENISSSTSFEEIGDLEIKADKSSTYNTCTDYKLNILSLFYWKCFHHWQIENTPHEISLPKGRIIEWM